MLILHIRLYCKQCSTRNCMDHSSWWFCIATHPKMEKVDDNTACSYYFHKNNDGGDNRQNQDAVLELFGNLKKDRVLTTPVCRKPWSIVSSFCAVMVTNSPSASLHLYFECDSLSKNDKTHKKKKWKSDIMGGRYSRRLDWQVGICQLVEILDFGLSSLLRLHACDVAGYMLMKSYRLHVFLSIAVYFCHFIGLEQLNGQLNTRVCVCKNAHLCKYPHKHIN